MRAFRFLNLTILSVLLGTSALLYAQDEKQQEDKPRMEEPKTKPEEPKKQDEAKPSHQQDETKPAPQGKQDEKMQKQDEKQTNEQGQEQPQNNGQPERREPGQQAGNAHPAGKGGHIPDDKFQAKFGRSHTFRAQTVIVSGRPQFQYGGYRFELMDAWPADWAYADDCYIDYIDGEYFLFDLLHPGIRIAVFVVT